MNKACFHNYRIECSVIKLLTKGNKGCNATKTQANGKSMNEATSVSFIFFRPRRCLMLIFLLTLFLCGCTFFLLSVALHDYLSLLFSFFVGYAFLRPLTGGFHRVHPCVSFDVKVT